MLSHLTSLQLAVDSIIADVFQAEACIIEAATAPFAFSCGGFRCGPPVLCPQGPDRPAGVVFHPAPAGRGKTISNHTIIRTITCNMDRTHTAALFKYNGPKGDTYRRLTMREAFLLMGFTEEEYAKASSLNFSYRKLNQLIGNSIVVNVLQAIFEAMLGDTYKKNKTEE